MAAISEDGRDSLAGCSRDHLTDGIDDQIGLIEVNPMGARLGNHLFHVVADAGKMLV
jgi:hypothetical protein